MARLVGRHRDDAGSSERRNGCGVVPDLAQNLRRMLAEKGRRTGDAGSVVLQPHRIAHGFLTLSMLSTMAYEACPGVEGTKTAVNYGFNRLRFVAPVPTGSKWVENTIGMDVVA